jgi:hypothetical protein
MSADDFEATMRSLNPQGTAFNERLAAVTHELNHLQAIERELRLDEAQFEAHVAALRQSLEGATRSLSSQYARRARLVDELRACDGHIDRLEAEKERMSQAIHACTTARQGQREHKLASLGIAHPSQAPDTAAADAAPPPPEVGDLLDCTTLNSKPAATAPSPSVDLLGLHTATTASEELLTALSDHPGRSAVGDLGALAAGSSGSLLSPTSPKATGAAGIMAGAVSQLANQSRFDGGPTPSPVSRMGSSSTGSGVSGRVGLRTTANGARGPAAAKSPGHAGQVDPFAKLLQ